jgi:hypothetical protein
MNIYIPNMFQTLEEQKSEFQVLDSRLIEAELETIYSPDEFTIPVVLKCIIEFCSKHEPDKWQLLMISSSRGKKETINPFKEVSRKSQV